MKKIFLTTAILLLSTNFGFGLTEKPKDSPITSPKSDNYPFNFSLKDSVQLQEYIRHLTDSLKKPDSSAFKKWDKNKKFYFKQPNDTSNVRRYFIPREREQTDSIANKPIFSKRKPYITHVKPDNMPVYVPADGYIPNKKVESDDNMPVKVPDETKQAEKQEISK